MAPSIPDRWILYKPCGMVIDGTRIICFKVPLKKSVQVRQKDIKEIWDIKALLKKVPKLGGVIDLTNTFRYYDPKELQEAGVIHKKILMPGRIIPPEDKVKEFMDTVDEFLGNNCDSLIGVHCTHGLNRTGYMVCRYMRDRLMVPARDAIKKFEKARGYQIERENYIADLLGKDPPPPDLGKETDVRPIYDNKMSYKSPLDNYEEEEKEEYSSTRFGRKRRFSGNSSRNNAGRKRNRRRDSNSSGSQRSYDYRYDY